jgi:iron complex outermembrane receptor protein
VEGSARLSPQFTLAANATVSRNKIEEFREVLYNYGTNFDEFNEVQNTYRNTDISFSPSLVAGSVLTWQLPGGVELAWLSKYVSRQFLDNTSNRSRALNPYWVNDLRLSYALRPARMREVVFSLLVNNIFDHEYESNGYTWGYLAGSAVYRQNYFYPQAGRNVIAMVAIKI